MPTPSKKQPTQVSHSASTEAQISDAVSKKKKATPVSSVSDVSSASTTTQPVVLPHVVKGTPTVAAPVVAVAPTSVPADATQPHVEPATDNVLSTIIDKVNSLASSIKDIQTNLKVLSKEYDKQQKIIEKAQKKRQNAKNSPSGFAKPNKISDELCDFIGVPHGTEKSRTDITRFINAYVKEHNLNKPENKRFILPDTKLKKILNVGDSDEINYFILQKLISHHFPLSASKSAAKVAVAAAV
uniref:DM2 domain-containing protein n=1 Tax=viral metagenome TaxID=1070528 RepID=A0A6C0LY07_9ZZZZ